MRAAPPWTRIETECDALLAALRASATLTPEMPPHLRYVLQMYWRCLRLFSATLVLLKAELPEEALIVARSLFEDSLRLQQLAADEVGRDGLILHLANKSIDERAGLLQEARTLGLDDDIGDELKSLKDQRRRLQAFLQRRGVKRLRRFMNEREAARRFGREDDYWMYCLAHEFVHGSDAAWMFAARVHEPNVRGLHARTNAPHVLAGVAEFAASSATHAAVAACAIFDWLKVDAPTEPWQRIRELLSPTAG